MRLAIVTPYPPKITGIGQYGYHVSRMLVSSNAFSHVSILTSHQPHTNGRVSSPFYQIIRGWSPNGWSAGISIISRLVEIQPDLVWFNIGASVFGRSPLANLSGYCSIMRSRRLGFPTIVTLHEVPELSDLRSLQAPGGVLARSGARLLTGIASRADVVCVTLKRYQNWLSPRLSGNRLAHIPLGAYHMPEYLPESAQPELLFFTTLAPFKGLEVLLDSFVDLKKTCPLLRLTIAGAEHIRFPGYLEKVKHSANHLEGVQWLGQVPETQVRDLFQRSQIVVLPYQASTGSSSVMWQAASWGRAMVASNLAETIASTEENGLKLTLFRSGDVQSLTAAIKSLLDSERLRKEQAASNMQAIQRHRPQDTCRAYFQAFNHALAAHGYVSRVRLPVGLRLETS